MRGKMDLDLQRPLILLIPDILTPQECEDWIGVIKSKGTEPAPINTPRGATIVSHVRNNRRAMFDDPERANQLFERVKDTVPRNIHGMDLVGVNERLRCYEYQAGQYFAPHLDGAFVRSDEEQSWYTFMVYLNEGFEGVETIFLVEPEKVITPRPGLALLFQHSIIHEGARVKTGTKYVVRTDLMYRRQAASAPRSQVKLV
jgi:hypothetical protein